MSKILTEYFKPSKALILVAILLIISMCLQFYVLPPVLKIKSEGENLEGTTMGVILIFSYTMTTLGLLFLITEYFNMKSRVKNYVKLTEFQNMPQEHSSTHVTVAVEPKKVEKPQKRGLFSRFSNRKSTKEQLNEEKTGSKDNLLKSIGKPKTQETLAKKPRTGLFSNLLKNNRQKKDKQVETTTVQVSSQKTLKVDASSKQVDTKPISTIVEKGVNPEAKIVKVPESASLTPPVKEPEQIIKPKSDSGVTDLLKSTNESSKVKPSESDSPHLKSTSGPLSQVELKNGAGDSAKLSTLSITSEVQKAAQTPLVTADSGIKADAILKMTSEQTKETDDALQKYKTVVVKVPDPMTGEKPIEKPLEKLEAPILVADNSQEAELDVEKIYADSEFLKVLTDLRKVVEELKAKKKNKLDESPNL